MIWSLYIYIMCSQTVNINCTFDAGYSFVGYTLDPLALKQARGIYVTLYAAQHMF